MGNVTSASGTGPERRFVKRDESFGSKSPHRTNRIACRPPQQHHTDGMANGIAGIRSPLINGAEPINGMAAQRQHRLSQLSQRSHSLEHSGTTGTHSPTSSRSSSSNTSYLNSILLNGSGAAGVTPERSCLRQSTEPMFAISGDLNPHQIGLVKRAWKQAFKAADSDETEIAVRLLLRVFELEPRNLAYFSLKDVPLGQLATRNSPVFMSHVKAFEPTLIHVMTHLTNATTLSKHLQQLGGRHVNYTGVTYKCSYWKCFTQSLIDVLMLERGNGSEELHDALSVLGDFCVEQMRIGYRIEYKLQCEAEKFAQAQQQRRQRRRDRSVQAQSGGGGGGRRT